MRLKNSGNGTITTLIECNSFHFKEELTYCTQIIFQHNIEKYIVDKNVIY